MSIEDRLFGIRDVARKFGVEVDELPAVFPASSTTRRDRRWGQFDFGVAG